MLINVTVFQWSGISPPPIEPSAVAGFCGQAGAAALCVGISAGPRGHFPFLVSVQVGAWLWGELGPELACFLAPVAGCEKREVGTNALCQARRILKAKGAGTSLGVESTRVVPVFLSCLGCSLPAIGAGSVRS